MPTSELQLGKNKITENFIETLKLHFKNHENVKIGVLRSARTNRGAVKAYSEEILEKLGNKFTARVIGFTIIIKKWRKEQVR